MRRICSRSWIERATRDCFECDDERLSGVVEPGVVQPCEVEHCLVRNVNAGEIHPADLSGERWS